MTSQGGNIIVPSGLHPWDHELATARSLAKTGYDVEFVTNPNDRKSPDIRFKGHLWEIKCPKSPKLEAFQRRVQKACQQSKNVIIDARRSKADDRRIIRALRSYIAKYRKVKRLLFVDKQGNIVTLK